MVANFGIDLHQGAVVHAIVSGHTDPDDICAHGLHEILQQRAGGLVKQVAAVFSGIGNHHVHLIELLACDGVGDQRCLMQGFIVSRFLDDAGLHHDLEGQFNPGLDHGNHQDALVVVLLFRNVRIGEFLLFKSGLIRSRAPAQEVGIIIGPVGHHGAGEHAGHDVVLVFCKQRPENALHGLGQVEGFQFGRIGQAVHHVGDTALLQSLGHGFPAVLDQLGGVARVHAQFDHAVEAEQ